MHLIEITTVEQSERVYRVPAHVLRTFQDLETFVRNAYGKNANSFDLHIHYGDGCTGRSEVHGYTYDALVASDMHWRGVNGMPMRYHVCFSPKTQMPQTPISNGSPSRASTHPAAAQPSFEAENNVIDHSPYRLSREKNNGTEQGGTKRLSRDCFPERQVRKKRKLRQSLTAIIGPPSFASPFLPPPQAFQLHFGEPLTAPEPTSVPNPPATPRAGTYDHPWSVSSRESSHPSSPISTTEPSRLDPPNPIKKREPGQPVDPHKLLYEFLLAKRLSKSMFMVGTLNREMVRPGTKLSSDGRLNTVAAGLMRNTHSLYYVVMAWDTDGRPLEIPFGKRLINSSMVDYFPEIKLTATGDHVFLRQFIIIYRRELSGGLPYRTASIVDLTEGDETSSDEGGYEEELLTQAVHLKLPKWAHIRIKKSDISGLPLILFLKPANEYDTTPNNTAADKSAGSAECTRCLEKGDKCRPSMRAGVTACHLCHVNNVRCSLADPPAKAQGNKNLASRPFSDEDEGTTSNQPYSMPANERESSARQASAPPEAHDESREDDQCANLSVTSNGKEGGQPLLTAADDRESAQQPPVPAEAQDESGEEDLRSSLSDAKRQGDPCAGSSPPSTFVKLNITFTDRIDPREYSSLLNFERRHILIPYTATRPDVVEHSRRYIKDEAANKSNVTDSHSKDLNEADIIVRISAPGAGEGAWRSRKERRPWIKSWNLRWEDYTTGDSLLKKHGGNVLDLTVEMWKHGSHGMP